jgi:hypothetical protein
MSGIDRETSTVTFSGTCCNALHCVATRCTALQRAALRCNALHCVADRHILQSPPHRGAALRRCRRR